MTATSQLCLPQLQMIQKDTGPHWTTRSQCSPGLKGIGIEDGHPRTLEEVGKVFNVTRERIRQIEAKALRKLRHPSRNKKLKDFLD